MGYSKALKQAYDLQDLAFDCAMSYREGLRKQGANGQTAVVISADDTVAIGRLIASWALCQERVRINRGKPLPGSRRPAPAKERSREGLSSLK